MSSEPVNAVPRHLAVIMDGNGRWATSRGLPRVEGHRAGAKTLENVLEWCGEVGVKYLTVYAFSTENWKRSAEEVGGLMKLFALFLKLKSAKLLREGVRFRVIGRRSDVPADLLAKIEALENKTAKCDRLQLLVAFSYGGRAEILDAAKRLAADLADGKLDFSSLSESDLSSRLYAPDVPDPDLVVRTSGELRVSNFLLWQIAYSEIYVTPTLWPDFDRVEFDRALASYSKRERRMGGRK